MAVKEIPISLKKYFTYFQNDYKTKLYELSADRDSLYKDALVSHKELSNKAQEIKEKYGFDLNSYPEFVDNKYSNGKFLRAATELYNNKARGYELVLDFVEIYKLAENQKTIAEKDKGINRCAKLIALTYKEYSSIIKSYYIEVHKKLVLEGYGYAFTGMLGWICINRCVLRHPRKLIDYQATKRRQKELEDKGVRIYNKEEAEWCKKHGIEYKAEDKRVFKTNEYCYEFCIIDSRIKNRSIKEFKVCNYVDRSLKGKTYDDLIELCDHDIKKICALPVDMKVKVAICDKLDKILYTKFIRNENQKPFAAIAYNRKNRQ